MKNFIVCTAVICLPFIVKAQQIEKPEKQARDFSLGVRNTISAFSHGGSEFGYGAGWHFRIQLLKRLNTEWFGDALFTNIHNKANRKDYHVGWSVMYYVIDPKGFTRKITPYALAGHCFDHTRVRINGNEAPARSRWNSAVQAGAGFHYNITPKFDISTTIQYMLHLGRELHAHENSQGEIEIEEHKNAGWEGHLLFNISVNYKIFKLWKPRK
jgi:opacity protein-like surface antigen